MAHILSPEAEDELDDIWYYVTRKSATLILQTGLLTLSLSVSSCFR
jgi:hypothetical protein